MEKALQKAVEGGWNYYGNANMTPPKKVFGPEKEWLGMTQTGKMHKSAILLDPTFWQALMIGTGHDVKNGTMRCKNYNPKYSEFGEKGCPADKCEYAGYINWKDEWHRFIDHLASGGIPETFFNNLLTK